MNIALIGYGKMGKEIEAMAILRGHAITLIVDKHNMDLVGLKDFEKVDVAIEFSTPQTAVQNIYNCFDGGVPVVVGTTGWYKKFEEVKIKCKQQSGCLFTASNFSVGVNLFFQLNKNLAQLMNNYPEYKVTIEEHHHIHKKDMPSGTSITIAEGILEKIDTKNKYTVSNSETNFNEPSVNEISIAVKREGEIPGTHIVKYESLIDDIEIKHIAHNRKGFALGALLAAEFIFGKKGIFEMSDLIKL